MEAAKVTPIEKGKELIIFTNALATFDIKEKTIQELEKATELEITDTASETVVRKFRQTAKSLQVGIEKHRLKLTREFKKKTDTAAGLLEPRVTAVYNNLDIKIKAVEAVKAEKAAAKARIEQERLAIISALMEQVDLLAKVGLRYNRSAEEIKNDLENLEMFEISSIDFQEHTEEAERVKAQGIIDTKSALKNREQWENDQAEAARIKKEQEAEAKKLADERAEFEAARVAEREKQAADRKILEKKEAEIKAKEEAVALKKYSDMWDEAHLINFNIIHKLAIEYNQEIDEVLEEQRLEDILECHSEALKMDAAFNNWLVKDEEARVEKLQQDKERAALIGPDKMLITTIATDLDKMISEYEIPVLNTSEANTLVVGLITALKAEIHAFEVAGGGLV